MSKFEYSAKEINAMIAANNADGMGKATMVGVINDLRKLKPILENLYDESIFYLSYWRGECGYHGMDTQSDTVKSRERITDRITQKIEEAYALVLTGLGETIDER